MRSLRRGMTAILGTALTCAGVFLVVEDRPNAVVLSALLVGGPAWAYAFALASEDEDFAGAARTRAQWLQTLPWTFVVAPLVLPNLVLLAAFVRDARADSGRSPLTWDRMRPGDGAREHHWPD